MSDTSPPAPPVTSTGGRVPIPTVTDAASPSVTVTPVPGQSWPGTASRDPSAVRRHGICTTEARLAAMVSVVEALTEIEARSADLDSLEATALAGAEDLWRYIQAARGVVAEDGGTCPVARSVVSARWEYLPTETGGLRLVLIYADGDEQTLPLEVSGAVASIYPIPLLSTSAADLEGCQILRQTLSNSAPGGDLIRAGCGTDDPIPPTDPPVPPDDPREPDPPDPPEPGTPDEPVSVPVDGAMACAVAWELVHLVDSYALSLLQTAELAVAALEAGTLTVSQLHQNAGTGSTGGASAGLPGTATLYGLIVSQIGTLGIAAARDSGNPDRREKLICAVFSELLTGGQISDEIVARAAAEAVKLNYFDSLGACGDLNWWKMAVATKGPGFFAARAEAIARSQNNYFCTVCEREDPDPPDPDAPAPLYQFPIRAKGRQRWCLLSADGSEIACQTIDIPEAGSLDALGAQPWTEHTVSLSGRGAAYIRWTAAEGYEARAQAQPLDDVHLVPAREYGNSLGGFANYFLPGPDGEYWYSGVRGLGGGWQWPEAVFAPGAGPIVSDPWGPSKLASSLPTDAEWSLETPRPLSGAPLTWMGWGGITP